MVDINTHKGSLLSDECDLLDRFDNEIIISEANKILENPAHQFYKEYKSGRIFKELAKLIDEHVIYFEKEIIVGGRSERVSPIKTYINVADTLACNHLIRLYAAANMSEFRGEYICPNIIFYQIIIDLFRASLISDFNLKCNSCEKYTANHIIIKALGNTRLELKNINISSDTVSNINVRLSTDMMPVFSNFNTQLTTSITIYSLTLTDTGSEFSDIINNCLNIKYKGEYLDRDKRSIVYRRGDIKTIQATLNSKNLKRYEAKNKLFELKDNVKITDIIPTIPNNVNRICLCNNNIRVEFRKDEKSTSDSYNKGLLSDGWVMIIKPT